MRQRSSYGRRMDPSRNRSRSAIIMMKENLNLPGMKECSYMTEETINLKAIMLDFHLLFQYNQIKR